MNPSLPAAFRAFLSKKNWTSRLFPALLQWMMDGGNRRQLLLAGLVAMLGTALGSVGDVLLLQTPGADYFAGDYLFMGAIAPGRIMAGALLGVLFIPLVLGGLWQMYTLLRPVAPVAAATGFALGVYFCCQGVVVHALFAAVGLAVHDGATEGYRWLPQMLDGLSAITVALHTGLSLLFAAVIWKKKTVFPKWVAVLNPLTIYLFLASALFWWPSVGGYTAPAGFNLSYLIFFGITTGCILRSDLK